IEAAEAVDRSAPARIPAERLMFVGECKKAEPIVPPHETIVDPAEGAGVVGKPPFLVPAITAAIQVDCVAADCRARFCRIERLAVNVRKERKGVAVAYRRIEGDDAALVGRCKCMDHRHLRSGKPTNFTRLAMTRQNTDMARHLSIPAPM